jgi:hypothetical protein
MNSVSRLLAVVGIYGLMLIGWTVAGIFMLIAPARFGSAIHESFGLFPAVRHGDTGKKLLLRMVGCALLGFAARFVLGLSKLLN